MKASPTAPYDLRTLVPYTFEESLANWADVLECDAECARERSPRARVSISAAVAEALAAHLRGAARLLQSEERP